jgi:hypothetical protein
LPEIFIDTVVPTLLIADETSVKIVHGCQKEYRKRSGTNRGSADTKSFDPEVAEAQHSAVGQVNEFCGCLGMLQSMVKALVPVVQAQLDSLGAFRIVILEVFHRLPFFDRNCY